MGDYDYQQRLGSRLRHIRRQQNLTLQQVEERSHGDWKAVVVGSYERGDRAVSVTKLAQLAEFYNVPVSELLPEDDDGTAVAGKESASVVLDVRTLEEQREHDGLAPLARFVHGVQIRRGDYNGRVITLRRDDLQMLSTALGVDIETFVMDLATKGILVSVG